MLISCFIVPTADHNAKGDLLAYVNDGFSSYAWGVALLAYLHTGIRKWKDPNAPKTSIDGSLWVLLVG